MDSGQSAHPSSAQADHAANLTYAANDGDNAVVAHNQQETGINGAADNGHGKAPRGSSKYSDPGWNHLGSPTIRAENILPSTLRPLAENSRAGSESCTSAAQSAPPQEGTGNGKRRKKQKRAPAVPLKRAKTNQDVSVVIGTYGKKDELEVTATKRDPFNLTVDLGVLGLACQDNAAMDDDELPVELKNIKLNKRLFNRYNVKVDRTEIDGIKRAITKLLAALDGDVEEDDHAHVNANANANANVNGTMVAGPNTHQQPLGYAVPGNAYESMGSQHHGQVFDDGGLQNQYYQGYAAGHSAGYAEKHHQIEHLQSELRKFGWYHAEVAANSHPLGGESDLGIAVNGGEMQLGTHEPNHEIQGGQINDAEHGVYFAGFGALLEDAMGQDPNLGTQDDEVNEPFYGEPLGVYDPNHRNQGGQIDETLYGEFTEDNYAMMDELLGKGPTQGEENHQAQHGESVDDGAAKMDPDLDDLYN